KVDDVVVHVDLLAQVTDVSADVYTLDDAIDFDGAQTVLEQAGPFPPRVRAEASVLGFLHQGIVLQARNAVLPGTPIYAAPDDLLRRFFSRDAASSISLGTLFNRRGVEVKLDPNGLSRHLAIIAQTGAGKSYLAGKILEDLLGLGATIVVLDPNSDYVQLRKVIEDERVPFRQARQTEHAGRIELFRVPGIQNRRYSEDLVGPSHPYTIRFSDLEAEDLCDVAGVPQNAERIREAVGNACARLRRRNVDYDPRELAVELAGFAGVSLDDPGLLPSVAWEDKEDKEDKDAPPPDAPARHEAPPGTAPAAALGAAHASIADAPDGDDVDASAAFLGGLAENRLAENRFMGSVLGAGGAADRAGGVNGSGRRPRGGKSAAGEEDEMRAARMALRYVRKLIPYPVWGHSNVDLDRLLGPMKLTVIDLAGTEKVVMAYTAEWLLSNLWQRALAGELRWPVFVVLEEAHNLVPGGKDVTKASRIVNTVAAEGRKFGVFLIVITQRPSKIADDTLSQCASQLIMRLTNPDDQKAVQRASEVVSQALLENLPGLNQGEVVVLGRLTRVPAMVRVAGRLGAEGGADINLAERFSQARSQALSTQLIGRAAPPAPFSALAPPSDTPSAAAPTTTSPPAAGRSPRKEVKLL
ncbi:MAG: ATP-binding protein, partial [Chloroflexota bacterium]|nr:ATP-binding protein [Chloroflexota bacterium]